MRIISKKAKSERGSYTLEACISLMAMVIAVAFVYSQVKVVICESIMQHAVDNMALEMSSYMYIFDKLGVIRHSQGDYGTVTEAGEKASDAIDKVGNIKENADDIVSTLTNVDSLMGIIDASNEIKDSATEIASDCKSMAGSIKEIINLVKKNPEQFKNDLLKVAGDGGGGAVNSAVNVLMREFYDFKLDAYLPTDRETFCKEYLIKEDSLNADSFKMSRLLPGIENNTVLVVIEYETNSPFPMFPVYRKIRKQAFTAAWLTDPGNGMGISSSGG